MTQLLNHLIGLPIQYGRLQDMLCNNLKTPSMEYFHTKKKMIIFAIWIWHFVVHQVFSLKSMAHLGPQVMFSQWASSLWIHAKFTKLVFYGDEILSGLDKILYKKWILQILGRPKSVNVNCLQIIHFIDKFPCFVKFSAKLAVISIL